jgi:hypothetical protein
MATGGNYWAVPNVTSVPVGNFVSAQRGEPFTNYMPLGGQLLDPELPDNIVLGLVASNSSKSVIANQAGGSNPTLRYNGTTSVWDLSNDGATYRQILTGTGTTGKLTKWSALGVLADSIISESGTVATIIDTLNVTTITTPASTDLVLNPTGGIKTKDLKPDLGLTRDIGQLINKYRGLYASELWVETLVQAQTMATIGGRIAVAPTTTLTADLASGTTSILASLKNNQPDLDDVLYLESNGAVEFVGVTPWMIRPTWKATATVALSTAPSLSTNIRPAASASVTLNISAYLTTQSSGVTTSKKMAALAQCAVTTTAALTTSVRLAASVSVAATASSALTDNIFEVDGDQTALFMPGRLFTIHGSTTPTNNGVFTTASSVYDAANTKTKVRPTTGFSTAAANLGWVAYFDSGPYVYRLKRNLNATGALAWPSGSALLNTGVIGDGYLDLYSTTGILASGTGPTIVGNVRTGGTFNQVAARWAIGNLNGLYGYVADTYGTAFGDPTGSWVKIDSVNGVRLGYNTTTKVQIDSSGNAMFTDSVSAGSANDVIVLSGVDPTYRLWIGSTTPASAPFKVSKTGAVTGTNVSFMAGGVTFDSSGLYINPTSAVGGGAYANDHAVRWTTDTTYRTAIWRSDDADVSPIKYWNFENIANGIDTVINNTIFYQRNEFSGLTGETKITMLTEDTVGDIDMWAGADDGSHANVKGCLHLGGIAGSGIAYIGVGTPIIQSGGLRSPSLTAGFSISPGSTGLLGPMTLSIVGSVSSQLGHFQRLSDGQTGWGHNYSFDMVGLQWLLDDTARSGWFTRFLGDTDGDVFQIVHTTAGTNPRTPITMLTVDAFGNCISAGGVYSGVGSLVAQVNGGGVYVRNAANNVDLQILYLDNSNRTTLKCNSARLAFNSASLGAVVAGGTGSTSSILVNVNGTDYRIALF